MQYFIGTPLPHVLSVHVGDFCWTVTALFQKISKRSVKELQTIKYLGFNISQSDHGVFMHDKEYIEEIEVTEMDKPNKKDHELLPHEPQQLWRVAG